MKNKIYTIGFSKKSAQKFFSLLAQTTANKLIDIRLNNASQLAGFTKSKDLASFLEKILNWKYVYNPLLAPTKNLLHNYQKKEITWNDYEIEYLRIIEQRSILSIIKENEIINGVLLCSEDRPEQCHRRLLAEYLKRNWENIEIIHLF